MVFILTPVISPTCTQNWRYVNLCSPATCPESPNGKVPPMILVPMQHDMRACVFDHYSVLPLDPDLQNFETDDNTKSLSSHLPLLWLAMTQDLDPDVNRSHTIRNSNTILSLSSDLSLTQQPAYVRKNGWIYKKTIITPLSPVFSF